MVSPPPPSAEHRLLGRGDAAGRGGAATARTELGQSGLGLVAALLGGFHLLLARRTTAGSARALGGATEAVGVIKRTWWYSFIQLHPMELEP